MAINTQGIKTFVILIFLVLTIGSGVAIKLLYDIKEALKERNKK